VNDRGDRLFFLEMGFGTTGYGAHIRGTFGSTLERRCKFLLVLRGVGKEKRNMQGIIMLLVALFVTVGASTVEHLARGTCYATGARFWTAHTGARG
jgi:hypothetical protein